MITKAYILHALSPLHAGVGQGVGVIDLPIAREKASNLPLVPGTSIKGVLRDAMRAAAGASTTDQQKVTAAFGPETANASDHAGALVFGDARLLCLPVRSFFGTFCWVTAPFVLARFKRDHDADGTSAVDFRFDGLTEEDPACAAVPDDSRIKDPKRDRLVLEDLDLCVSNRDVGLAGQWADMLSLLAFPKVAPVDTNAYWRGEFRARFAVIRDEEFSFLYDTATEIATRIHIDEHKGTVKKGQLWWEENLPAESILWGVVGAEEPRMAAAPLAGAQGVLAYLREVSGGTLQFGGHATVGRGRSRFLVAG